MPEVYTLLERYGVARVLPDSAAHEDMSHLQDRHNDWRGFAVRNALRLRQLE